MPFTTPVASPVRGVGIGALVVQTPGPTAARKLGGLRRDTTRDSGSSQLAANARRKAIGTNHGGPVHIVPLNRSRVLSRMWHTCRRHQGERQHHMWCGSRKIRTLLLLRYTERGAPENTPARSSAAALRPPHWGGLATDFCAIHTCDRVFQGAPAAQAVIL